MTKIEQWQVAKLKAERLRKFANDVRDTHQADKFGVEALVFQKTYLGFYGSSSVSEWPDEVRKAMAAEFVKRLREAANWAAQTAEAEAERARYAAKEEAEAVLKEVAPTR